MKTNCKVAIFCNLKSKGYQSQKEMPLQDASISSAWSSHSLTEKICGNEGDISLGSETWNYSAILASQYMGSEPWFQQGRGSLRASLLDLKGQMFKYTVRKDSSQPVLTKQNTTNHTVWPCIAVSQSLSPSSPLLPVCSVAMAVVKRHILQWESNGTRETERLICLTPGIWSSLAGANFLFRNVWKFEVKL